MQTKIDSLPESTLYQGKGSLSYPVGIFGKLLKAYGGLVSFIALYLAIIVNVLGGLTNIIRYGKKSTVVNSGSLSHSENLRNVSSHYSFSIFRKCLNIILRFDKNYGLTD